MTSQPLTTLVSAPGKVLVAGGYLVLDPAYPGLVISTSSRYYALARPKSSPSPSDSASPHPMITLRSPQFVDAVWQYRAVEHNRQWVLYQTAESREKAGANPFVSLTLSYALRLASEVNGFDQVCHTLRVKNQGSLEVVVLADNEFCSQRETLGLKPSETPTIEALQSLPRFAKQSCRIQEVHKTGLGSSAALTTSLAACLMMHLGVVEYDSLSNQQPPQLSEHNLALIHNLAQLAHCAAQGKIGSGFDVSAAVWGSQIYRRFEPTVLQPCLEEEQETIFVEGGQPETDETTIANMLQARIPLLPILDPTNILWRPSPLNSSLTQGSHPTAIEGAVSLLVSEPANQTDDESEKMVHRPAPLQLPPGFSMVLADVNAGSHTPSLVSKVLEWRKLKPEWAKQLYNIISSSNQSLADGFLKMQLLASDHSLIYHQAISLAADQPSGQWERLVLPVTSSTEETESIFNEIISTLIEIRNSLRSIRAGMRELGTRSQTSIEPIPMGCLLNSILDKVNGTIGGGVPGAGGYDALFLLYLNSSTFLTKLDQFVIQFNQSDDVVDGEDRLYVGLLLTQSINNDSFGMQVQVKEKVVKVLQSCTSSSPGLRVEQIDQVMGLKKALE